MLFLLLYMVQTMNRISLHLTLMEIRVLENEVLEEEEWFESWDEMDQEDKEDHLRIAVTTT